MARIAAHKNTVFHIQNKYARHTGENPRAANKYSCHVEMHQKHTASTQSITFPRPPKLQLFGGKPSNFRNDTFYLSTPNLLGS